MESVNLIQKYNIPGPRYTSYPTVPFWDKTALEINDWKNTVLKTFKESNEKEGISLYIHLPFCENLCTFCACHKHITKRHEDVEDPYIATVLKEWKLYIDILGKRPKIHELHLGGGTPTFFSSDNLKRLIDGIFKYADRFEETLFSYEGHPNNTTKEQIQVLFDLGFKRNSFGIQDYDSRVQLAINRIQPFENVEQVTRWSREIGYESISHDLIFGLPFQTEDSVRQSIEKTLKLMPDRIAFYSYAHVPWIKGNGQRGFDENDLPKPKVKRRLYELGKQMFFDNGYVEIGMDHFALKSDSLTKAMHSKKLHRNFMGYTAGKTKLMVGLGMSAISDSWYGFAQNEKTTKGYEEQVNRGEIPIFRGHLLTEEDLVVRKHILNLMCHLETDFNILPYATLDDAIERLKPLFDDDLITFNNNKLTVKEEGRMFIRNVCMAFDLRLIRNRPDTRLFSMTV